MKKKVLLSSIVTIALCLCLIVGSTFALFTSKSSMNIAVTAGEVKVEAVIDTFQIYSVQPTEGGSIEDEFGGTYEYEKCTDTLADGTTKVFANGGTAAFENRTLTLDKITPGDKVSFNIASANKSNVAIQYRYVIECKNGSEKLMSTMLLSVGQHEVEENGVKVMVPNTAYPAVKSYTSPWVTLEANQDDITDVPVVLEFPVTVGNDYQNEKLEINVYVEAYQSNADLDNTNTEAVVVFLDGSHKLLGIANDDITINEGQNVNIDMDGATVNGLVTNNGTLDLSNGTIADPERGFENYGSATLTDVKVNAGSAAQYSNLTSGAGAETVYNNVELNATGGGVGAADGASVVFNSGSIDVNTTSTSGRYLFYAEGAGTTITINGGNFDFNRTQNQKRAYICATDGTTVYVNGGTFGKASTRDGYKEGIKTDGTGTVIITGGTFGFDPTKWMADGYKVEKVGANWVVSPMANDTDSLNEAIANGETYIALAAGTYKFPGSALKAGVTLECAEGTVFEGLSKLNINGATVIGATFSNPTGSAADQTINGVFKNCTFTGTNGLRWAYAGETVVFENCVFDGSVYGVHFDGGANEVIFKNCTFSGFNALGSAITKVTMENCTFKANGKSGYNGINMWGNTDMIGCTFEFEGLASYEWIDLCGAGKTATFTNCVMSDGTDLADVVTKRNSDAVIIIDGVVQ